MMARSALSSAAWSAATASAGSESKSRDVETRISSRAYYNSDARANHDFERELSEGDRRGGQRRRNRNRGDARALAAGLGAGGHHGDSPIETRRLDPRGAHRRNYTGAAGPRDRQPPAEPAS